MVNVKMTETKNKKKRTNTNVKENTKRSSNRRHTSDKKVNKAPARKVTSTKKAVAKKTKTRENQIFLEDLETREPDLEKTVVIRREDLENAMPDMEKTRVIDSDLITEVGERDEKKLDKEIEETRPPKKNESKPQTILGLTMPVGNSRKERNIRKKLYLKDALVFAIFVPIFDLLAMLFIRKYSYLMITNSPVLNYLITLLIDFVLVLIVTYVIDYIFGEDAVKHSKK